MTEPCQRESRHPRLVFFHTIVAMQSNVAVCAPIVQPSTEICDNRDNDCDGEVDEGDVQGTGGKCSTGKAGVCNAGTKRCRTGTITCVQDKQPSIEICNKLDDNCNNQVDEECVSAAEAKKAKGK